PPPREVTLAAADPACVRRDDRRSGCRARGPPRRPRGRRARRRSTAQHLDRDHALDRSLLALDHEIATHLRYVARMTARRLLSVLVAGLLASATVVAAQPKQPAAPRPPKAKQAPKAAGRKTPTPVAPAKDPDGQAAGSAAPTGAAAGSAAGAAVQMAEDPPPRDATGTEENPEAPHTVTDDSGAPRVTAALDPAMSSPVLGPLAYPLEAAARPITLPQNLSEV